MGTRRIEIPTPTTVGELLGAVSRILSVQSLVDTGRLVVLESRRTIIRERLETKFGTPADEIPHDTPISRRFSQAIIGQWMN